MEFMELMTEWLLLREQERDPELLRSPETKHRDWERKLEIEQELNKRMRGEL